MLPANKQLIALVYIVPVARLPSIRDSRILNKKLERKEKIKSNESIDRFQAIDANTLNSQQVSRVVLCCPLNGNRFAKEFTSFCASVYCVIGTL